MKVKSPTSKNSVPGKRAPPAPLLISHPRKSLNPPALPMPLSTKSEPVPINEKRNNLENWFKALLRCREKRKVEMKIAADFGYIVYSLVTYSVNRPGNETDISDGTILCELLSTIYPGVVPQLGACQTLEDKIRNLGKYCDACL